MPDHVINVTPDEFQVGIMEGGSVGLRFSTAEVQALLPALELRLRLAPNDARNLAGLLQKKADEAEAAL